MRSLLPKHLRDLFQKEEKREQDVSRRFALDTKSNLVLGQTASQLPKARQLHFEKERENLARWRSLTPREQEVTALLCMGQRNYQIAETLGIAFGTVKSHLENIFKKFNLRDRHAIRLALRDWDFPTWWKDRHLLPAPFPSISTYR